MCHPFNKIPLNSIELNSSGFYFSSLAKWIWKRDDDSNEIHSTHYAESQSKSM